MLYLLLSDLSLVLAKDHTTLCFHRVDDFIDDLLVHREWYSHSSYLLAFTFLKSREFGLYFIRQAHRYFNVLSSAISIVNILGVDHRFVFYSRLTWLATGIIHGRLA